MYVVAGTTGNTGSVVARELRARGHEVRALVRRPEAASEAIADETVICDLTDQVALAAALRGAQGAYLLLPPFFGHGILAHQERVARSIATALRDAQLPRTVLLSSVGAEHSAGTGPIVSVHVLESLVKDVPHVTALRAAYFQENWLALTHVARTEGILPSFIPDQQAFAMVATPDIGKAAAELLLQAEAPKRVVQLAGPRDFTSADAAEAFAQALQRDVRAVTLPPDQASDAFVQAGLPREAADLFAELYQAAHGGKLGWQPQHDVRRGSSDLLTTFRSKLAAGAE